METPSPALFPDGAVAPACFMSGTPVPPQNNQSEDIDGCDVEAEVLTSDEELPESEGGVA